MKKVFLLSLGLILGLSAFAQRQVIKNDLREGIAKDRVTSVGKEMTTGAATYAPKTGKSVVINRYEDMEEADVMWTSYDLQSNQFVANRMYMMPNGSVAVAETMSHEMNLTASDRGTGYSFYNGSEWSDEPEARIEPFKTGWPSLARWGANGEILLAHGNNGMQCFTRETAGEGEWEYRGALPPYPAGYPYTTNYATWPRVVTCGDNNNVIIAVAALQQSVSSDETDLRTCFWRSTDATNWEVSYGPLADLGLGYEIGFFSADDYALAANGHNVALIYSGCLTNSVWLFNSTDDGATWTSTRVWEHPFEGVSLDEPGLDYGDTLFAPMNSSIVIDNNGVTHVAMNTFEFSHWADTQPGYYSYFYGRTVDGILYWNSTMEAPMQSPDGNPFHAARLWWPAGEGYVHMEPDSTRWIGFIPMYEGVEWDNDMFYHENYHSKFYGASGHPALSCDSQGNLACAFSTPTTNPERSISTQDQTATYYARTIFASYRSAADGYWIQDEDDLMEDFMLSVSDGLFTTAVQNTYNLGEFWFAYQYDDAVGFAWGSEPDQQSPTENTIRVSKIFAPLSAEETEAKDVVYSIYPNPATDYVVVSSAMSANATITFVNLAGQTVKSFNKALVIGDNNISIDLESGVYFCTIEANGFSKTTKVIVK